MAVLHGSALLQPYSFSFIIPENGEMKMPVSASFCLSLRLKTVRERLILIGKKTCGKEGKG
jgi:hypothetical protein